MLFLFYFVPTTLSFELESSSFKMSPVDALVLVPEVAVTSDDRWIFVEGGSKVIIEAMQAQLKLEPSLRNESRQFLSTAPRVVQIMVCLSKSWASTARADIPQSSLPLPSLALNA